MRVMKAAASALVLLVLVSSAAAVAAAAEAEGCREELISFSSCLAYVSYPPNNLTESASEKCCKAFSRAVESVCLCYVVGDPLILGFPLNRTRLFSLSSLCPSPFSTSFPSLCSSNSSSLPPLTTTASTQPLGSSTRAGGGRGGRIGGGGGEGSSGRTKPFGAGTIFHRHSSSSTLTPLLTFSIFLAIFSALHNT